MKKFIIAIALMVVLLLLPRFFLEADPINTEFRLSWTVPHPGSMSSGLEIYSLRYSLDPDSLSSYFEDCSEVSGLPDPGVPGSKDSVVFNLIVETEVDYFFGVKTRSDKGYWSVLSNVHIKNVPDSAAPTMIYDLDEF